MINICFWAFSNAGCQFKKKQNWTEIKTPQNKDYDLNSIKIFKCFFSTVGKNVFVCVWM